MSVADVEWLARDVSATELMEDGDANSIVEFVGNWVEANCEYDTEDDWSDLCQVFYDWWGCGHLGSHTPEWQQFWEEKVKEECAS